MCARERSARGHMGLPSLAQRGEGRAGGWEWGVRSLWLFVAGPHPDPVRDNRTTPAQLRYGDPMRFFLSLLLLTTATLAAAQAPALTSRQEALDLAVASQKVLNEYAISAMEPDAMKYAQRLRLTQAALDAQYRQWPALSAGTDAWTPLRICQTALQQASTLAALSASKAVRKVSEPEFQASKARLQQLRSECDALIRRARPPA